MADQPTNTPPAELDPALQKTIADEVYRRTQLQVEAKLTGMIAKKESDIRDGVIDKEKPDFWDQFKAFLMSAIFQLAEALGLEKQLSRMGSALGLCEAIPEDSEVKAASEQVAKSVSNAMSDPKVLAMRPEDAQKAISERVAADLQRHHDQYPSFSDARLAEMAQTVGKESGTAENLASVNEKIAQAVALKNAPAEDVKTAGPPEQRVKQRLTVMADELLKGMSGDKDPKLVAASKAQMIEVGSKLIMEHKELLNDPKAFTEEYIAALKKDLAISQNLKQLGANLDDDGIKSIIAARVGRYKDALLADASGKEAVAPKQVDPAIQAVNDIQILTSAKLEDKIVDRAMQKYNDGRNSHVPNIAVDWLAGGMAPFAKKLDEYRDHPPADPAEITNTRKELYKALAKDGKAFTDVQKEIVSHAVAEATVEVLKDPNNRNLSQPQMADALQASIESHLKKAQPEIDQNGTSIKDINKKTDIPDILAMIAKEGTDALRNPANQDEYKKIIAMQTQLGNAPGNIANAKEKAASEKPVADALGIQGGNTHDVVSLPYNANKKPAIGIKGAPIAHM